MKWDFVNRALKRRSDQSRNVLALFVGGLSRIIGEINPNFDLAPLPPNVRMRWHSFSFI
ncbi:hypothetical protein ACFOWB_25160 [Chenggangzhangella methanolivorans]|uniref:hypothetical protein n=1 Tax=Chenggangzhangella methanolivorans TaxID=1437009 RepID=UPI003612BCE1